MDLGTPVLPTFIKDNTDRNRTSPFAFTGNKFEFRMPGAEINLSDANMVLNTIVAKTLADFADALDGSKDFDADAKAYMKQVLTDHQRIVFNGNNYGDEWIVEAGKRGLLNLTSTPEALPQYMAAESIELFEKFGVLSSVEVESRYEVKLEHYSKKINIEGLVTARMARARFIPAIIEFSTTVAASIGTKKDVSGKLDTSAEEDLLVKLSSGINTITKGVDNLLVALDAAAAVEDSLENARAYLTKVIPAMSAVRAAVDEMELIVGHDYWPVPTYNHILFYT
jgi:glutamine synthetase